MNSKYLTVKNFLKEYVLAILGIKKFTFPVVLPCRNQLDRRWQRLDPV
jgi:hypothetical protein